MKLNNNDDSHNSGLNLLIYNMLLDIESHPAWVCGLKLLHLTSYYVMLSHTLRGCVDWNSNSWLTRSLNLVTPCVGVWIETVLAELETAEVIVTPCVGVWIETSDWFTRTVPVKSHPAWVCGLKLSLLLMMLMLRCHTLRGCVDWNVLK